MAGRDCKRINGWERALMAAERVKEPDASCDSGGSMKPAYRTPWVGGNAVAEWVGRVDPEAVRNTRDTSIS